MNTNNLLVRSTALFRYKWIVIALMLSAMAFFFLQLPKLRTENNTSSFLPSGDEDVRINDYYNSQKFFGSSDSLIVGIESDDALSAASLGLVRELETELRKRARSIPSLLIQKYLGLTGEETETMLSRISDLDVSEDNYERTLIPLLTDANRARDCFGFSEDAAARLAKKAVTYKPRLLFDLSRNPIKKIRTILTEDYVEYRDGELVTEALFPWGELSGENLATLRARVDSWSVYEGYLVSKDRRLTAVIVELRSKDAIVANSVDSLAEEIIAEKNVTGLAVHLGGEIYLNSVMDKYMNRDVSILFPIVLLLMAATLFFFFRTWQGIAFPFVAIAVSIIGSLGIMALLGISINIVTSSIPIMLTCVVAAYGIHQMSHYYENRSLGSYNALVRNMETVGMGLILSGLTTVIGFATLVNTPFGPIREFGAVIAIGILLGMIAAMYLIPSLILVDPTKKRGPVREPRIAVVEKTLSLLVTANRRHSPKILVAFAVLAAFIGFQAFKVRSDFNPLTFFRDGDPVRDSNELLGEKLSGTQMMNIVLDLSRVPESGHVTAPLSSDEASSGTILTPEILGVVESLADEIKKEFPETIGRVSTVNDLLRKINFEMNERSPGSNAIPDSRELISQYMMLFSGDIRDFVSSDSTKLNLIVTMRESDTRTTTEIRDFALGYLRNSGLTGVNMYVAGTGQLNVVANRLMVKGTLEGLVYCILITFFLLLPLIRNIRMTLISMIPIFFMLLVNFGVLGAFDITFDMGTSIAASVAIGLGIDFSIHFISWYRTELKIHNDAEKALDATIVNKGRAIVYNMLVVVWGFVALLFSSFVPLANFGLLVSLCVISMAIGSLVIVPAVIRSFARGGCRFVLLGKGSL